MADKWRQPGMPVTQSFEAAKADLSPELQVIFEALCEDVIAWSKYYYGRKLISYSILKELVAAGWTKNTKQ